MPKLPLNPFFSISSACIQTTLQIPDAALRNAVLMIDDVLSEERKLGIMVETAAYKHVVCFYQGNTAQLGYFRKAKDKQKAVDIVIELPRQKILWEVK